MKTLKVYFARLQSMCFDKWCDSNDEVELIWRNIMDDNQQTIVELGVSEYLNEQILKSDLIINKKYKIIAEGINDNNRFIGITQAELVE